MLEVVKVGQTAATFFGGKSLCELFDRIDKGTQRRAHQRTVVGRLFGGHAQQLALDLTRDRLPLLTQSLDLLLKVLVLIAADGAQTVKVQVLCKFDRLVPVVRVDGGKECFVLLNIRRDGRCVSRLECFVLVQKLQGVMQKGQSVLCRHARLIEQ